MFIYWFSQLLNLKYYICQPFGNVHLNTGKRIKNSLGTTSTQNDGFSSKKMGFTLIIQSKIW